MFFNYDNPKDNADTERVVRTIKEDLIAKMLRSQKKIGIILISIFIIPIILHVVLYSTKKKSLTKWDTVRPSGFPEILTVPESAYDIKYHKPSDATKAGYTVCFRMNDFYPAVRTMGFIKMNLILHHWHLLEHSLLNPNDDFVPYRKWYPDKDKNGEIYWDYTEEWLNENDEKITVHLSFRTGQIISDDNKLSMEEFEKMLPKVNDLFVQIGLLDANSWVRPFILKYKKLYPEEFNK